MNDTSRIRAGKTATMPTLGDRELVYSKDENALYIGNGLGGKKRIGGGESDVFIAVQKETPAQEVMDAIEAGKVVLARSGNTYYLLSNYDSSLIRFSRADQSTTNHLTLNRSTDAWAEGSTTHAKSKHTHTSADITFTDEDKQELVNEVVALVLAELGNA